MIILKTRAIFSFILRLAQYHVLMDDDEHRAQIAIKLLADRYARYVLFPGKLFDEYAWNMLLHLFIARQNGEEMSESKLIAQVNVSTREGQRWLYQLAKDGQIEPRAIRQDVVLTSDASNRLRKYLDIAKIC